MHNIGIYYIYIHVFTSGLKYSGYWSTGIWSTSASLELLELTSGLAILGGCSRGLPENLKSNDNFHTSSRLSRLCCKSLKPKRSGNAVQSSKRCTRSKATVEWPKRDREQRKRARARESIGPDNISLQWPCKNI